MWESIKKLFTRKKEVPVNPAIFHNDLAYKTSWEPLKHGGQNYKTHKLTKLNNNSLSYKASSFNLITSGLLTFGPLLFFILLPIFKEDHKGFEFPIVLLLILLTAGGIYSFYLGLRPNVFDKKTGFYYKSYKIPTSRSNSKERKGWISLDEINALQIIKERVKTKNSSYKSYEINIVLSDGERFNIVDHSSYNTIKEDAKTIADFLGVPYWDATAPYLYQPETLKVSTSSYTEQDLDQPYDSTKPRKL